MHWQYLVILPSNPSSRDVKISWLGQEVWDSGGGRYASHPPLSPSGRLGDTARGRLGKIGDRGGFRQPTGRDRPVGRMARRFEQGKGRVKP